MLKRIMGKKIIIGSFAATLLTASFSPLAFAAIPGNAAHPTGRTNSIAEPLGLPQAQEANYVWNNELDDLLHGYAKKTKYQCKICGRIMNSQLVMAGHVRGEHHKFVPSLHYKKI